MKRELISIVAVVWVLFIVILLVSRSGSTQSAISNCKQPFGILLAIAMARRMHPWAVGRGM